MFLILSMKLMKKIIVWKYLKIYESKSHRFISIKYPSAVVILNFKGNQVELALDNYEALAEEYMLEEEINSTWKHLFEMHDEVYYLLKKIKLCTRYLDFF